MICKYLRQKSSIEFNSTTNQLREMIYTTTVSNRFKAIMIRIVRGYVATGCCRNRHSPVGCKRQQNEALDHKSRLALIQKAKKRCGGENRIPHCACMQPVAMSIPVNSHRVGPSLTTLTLMGMHRRNGRGLSSIREQE